MSTQGNRNPLSHY